MIQAARSLRALGLLAGLALSGAATAETVLHRGNGTEPQTLDPALAVGLPEAQIIYDLFEGLVSRGPDGKAVPGLAERWEISPDGLTWIFHLRQARWSDGSEVTAEDVLFTYRRIVDPATASTNAHYLWVLRHGKPISTGAEKDITRLGVRAIDARTVELRLEHPAAYLPQLLSYPMLAVVSAANVKAAGRSFTKPGALLSSGAYALAEAVPQAHVKLVRNKHHWAAGTVAIDAVYFHATEDQDTELRRYRAGELQMTWLLPPAQIGWARAHLPADLHIAPWFSSYYYAPNLTREPWRSSRALRAALSLAVDRQALVDKITLAGEVPSFSYVPAGITGYAPAAPEWSGWTQARREAEARRLLEAAGYGPARKLSVELLFNNSASHRRVAVALAGMWKKVLGIEVSLLGTEWSAFLNARHAYSFRDLARQGYIGAYEDAGVFLEFLRSDAGADNPSAYANPAFDALLDQAGAETDPQRRNALLHQAEAMLLDDHAVLPLYTYSLPRLVNPRIKGYVDNPLDVHPTRYLSLAHDPA